MMRLLQLLHAPKTNGSAKESDHRSPASQSKNKPPLDELSSIGYMAHLDGIRAFAVCAVILEHWASGMPRPIRELVANLDLGAWGVECFFVLSGFLITQLLLQARDANQSILTALGHFYSRRALRIFPAYYLLLLLCAVLYPGFMDYLAWHLFYLGNLYPLAHDTFVPAGGHFWSLAVEEQFYLAWPFVVLLAPTQRLIPITITLCIMAPLSRLGLWFAMGSAPHLSMWTFPTTTIDLLGFGAFLACVKRQFLLTESCEFAKRLYFLGYLSLLIYLIGYFYSPDSAIFLVLARTLAAFIFGAIVFRASFGFSGLTSAVMGHKFIVWIGVLSYGLYLFHPFIPKIYQNIIELLGLSLDSWGIYYVRIPLLTLTLLVITATSYHLIEQPIRAFRKHFS